MQTLQRCSAGGQVHKCYMHACETAGTAGTVDVQARQAGPSCLLLCHNASDVKKAVMVLMDANLIVVSDHLAKVQKVHRCQTQHP